MPLLEKYGKLLLEIIIVSVFTAVISSLIVYIIGAVGPIGGVFAGVLTAFITLFLFVWALQIHPGKESFLETIPVIVLAAAVVGLLRVYIPSIPAIVTDFTWQNLAILLSSLFLADTIVKRYILR